MSTIFVRNWPVQGFPGIYNAGFSWHELWLFETDSMVSPFRLEMKTMLSNLCKTVHLEREPRGLRLNERGTNIHAYKYLGYNVTVTEMYFWRGSPVAFDFCVRFHGNHLAKTLTAKLTLFHSITFYLLYRNLSNF